MSEQSKEKDYKIEKVFLRNYKGIEEKEIALNCKSFIVYASNGEGKTSLLNAVEELFTGKATSKQIKKDTDKAEIWAVAKEIGSGVKYKIKRVITEKSNRLDITCDSDPNFEPTGGPQKWLNDVFGEISFDLGNLLSKSKEEQVKQLKSICGIDTSKFDEKIALAEEKRKEANVLLKQSKAVFDSKVETIKGVDIEDLPTPVVVSDLVQELQTIKENNSAVKSYDEKIKALKDEIKTLEFKLQNLDISLQEHEEVFSKLEPVKETKELEEKIKNAEIINDTYQKVQAYKEAKEKYGKDSDEFELWKGRLESQRTKRQEYVNSAKLPVEGLEFNDEKGLLYNDIPLSEWNTAERAFVEAMIKMSRKDIHLKVVRIENASLLDNENIERLTKACTDAGYQVAFEVVAREKQELKIEYIDETTNKVEHSGDND